MTASGPVTCPKCGACGVLASRLGEHQKRGACAVAAWKREMARLDYRVIDSAIAMMLAVECQDDLLWLGEPARKGPTTVDSDDTGKTLSGVWWPAWCDFLAQTPPYVFKKDVHNVLVARVRFLSTHPEDLRAYKARVRVWLAQGVEPEERFRVQNELVVLHDEG